jgi:hypothetical protein
MSRKIKPYVEHKLSDIVIITLLAVMSEADEWIEIGIFAKKKEGWLRGFLELPRNALVLVVSTSSTTGGPTRGRPGGLTFFCVFSILLLLPPKALLSLCRSTCARHTALRNFLELPNGIPSHYFASAKYHDTADALRQLLLPRSG